MKTIKVAETTGIVLDYLVAKAQDRKDIKIFAPSRPTDRGWIEVRFNPEPKAATARFDPTVSWEFGGPIIDLEKIQTSFGHGLRGDLWFAERHRNYAMGRDTASQQYGPTPLVAAMRCYVASKLGGTAEVPDELT